MTPYETNLSLRRIGVQGDGGYVIPETSFLPDFVISPGIGTLTSFERYFAEIGVPCLMIDGTIAKLPENHSNFIFLQKNIGLKSNDATISLSEISDTYQYCNAILQMDIEGGEYDALKTLDNADLSRFCIIVIELHGLSRILDLDSGMKELESLLIQLNTEHVCVHAHTNNIGGSFNYLCYTIPNIVELTFVRRELVSYKVRKLKARTKLDTENDSSLRPIEFPIFPDA